ncbi:Uncharacterised protein [Mycobacteroides abscessus subsp. massiliense]|nr:Uncharacterised protein [Mycobacteroides abscessus subsp. massiliense]
MRMPRTVFWCGASVQVLVVLGTRQSGVSGLRRVALGMSLSFEAGTGRTTAVLPPTEPEPPNDSLIFFT